MSERQTVTVEVDAGEMFGSQQWQAYRRDIDEHGAKGIGDGFGLLTIKVGDRSAVHLQLHEDAIGHVVLTVVDALAGREMGKVDVELYGAAPPRRGTKLRKDRRFGDREEG